MTRHQVQAGVVLILLILLSGFCIQRFKFTTEITHFLPTGGDQNLLNLSRAITDSELTRRMILSVSAPDEASASAGAGALAEKLRDHPQVAWVRTSPGIDAGQQKAVYDLYFPRRLLFLSNEPEVMLPERLSDAGLVRAARKIKRTLARGTNPLTSRIAGADPLGAFPDQLARFRDLRDDNLRIKDGRFVSEDGRHGIIFLATRSSAFRSGDQAPLLEAIERAFGEVQMDYDGTLVLEQSGFNRFAVASERGIIRDIVRISILSTVGAILLFFLVFRSPRYIMLLLITVGAGMVSGLGACLALFGQVHGITLAFGASLIGVCIDYPIHFFNHHTFHPDPGGPTETLRRIWGAVFLGALTTIAGLAGMAWTSFPGIREIALFAPAGIIGALVTSRYVLPPLMPRASGPTMFQQRLADALTSVTGAMENKRGLLVSIIVAALLLGFVGLPIARWTDDLASLNNPDPAMLEEDRRVRERVTSVESGRFVVAIAEKEEVALRRNDAVFSRLDRARADGLLENFRSLHSLIWSRDLQNRNFDVIRSEPSLAERARAAFVSEGFRPGALDPFFETLRAEPPEPLTLADLRRGPLADGVRPFLVSIPPGDDVGILTFLRGVTDSDALSRRLDGLDGVFYFDQTAHLREVYERFRMRTQQSIAVGLVAVILLVYGRYRRIRHALAAFLPALLAAFATLGLLALLGIELNLLNLVGTLLVLSMGVDYGIFMVETRAVGEARTASLLSIVIASLTTVLSFGLMGLSDNPALRGLGLTTGVGSLLSLLLAPTVAAVLGLRPGVR